MSSRENWLCFTTALCILLCAAEVHNVISGLPKPYDKAVHYWPLDSSTELQDVVTNITGIRDGRVRTRYFKGPGKGYLFIPNSRVKFGRFLETCVIDPSQCVGYLTVSLWIKYTVKQYNVYRKQFFIGTANKGADGPGFSIRATPMKGQEERVTVEVNDRQKTWKGHTNVKPGTWTQLGFSWSNTSGLTIFRNCARVKSITAYQLRPTRSVIGNYLYLVKAPGRGKAAFNVSYDDVAVWYSALQQVDKGKICSKKVGPPVLSNQCSNGITWISVQWKPSLPDFDMVTAFIVWYKYTASESWAKREVNSTSYFFNITGLAPSSNVQIQIQNKIRGDNGQSSKTVSCETAETHTIAIEKLRIVATSSRAILIAWKPTSYNTTIKEYWILYKDTTSGSDITKLEVGIPAANEFLISGLTPNMFYKIHVVSVGEQFPHIPVTLNASTDSDDFRSASPPNVRLVNRKTVQMNWTRPADESMRYWYRVFMQWSEGNLRKSQEIYRGSLTSYTYISSENLPISQVKYVVMAMEPNAITTSPKSLTIKSVSWDSALITWSPSNTVPSEIPDRYHVIIKSSNRIVKFATNKTFVNVAGFKQMTSYRVNVQQGNNKGYGPLLSSDVMFRTSDTDECAGMKSNCWNPTTMLVFDNNQCIDSAVGCSSNARCINTEGSFFCKCNHGYIGDGWRCREIPRGTTEEDFCQEETMQEIKWGRTIRGRNETALCPQGITGIAIRQCAGSTLQPAKWDVPDLSGCVSKWALDMSDMANDPSVSVSTVADQTAKLTERTDNIYPGDLKVVVNVLDLLTAREGKMGPGNIEQTKKFTRSMVNTASNILDSKTIKQWKFIPQAKRKSNAGTLINSMDSVALNIARTGNNSRTAMPNVVLDVKSTSSKSSDIVIGSIKQTYDQPYAVFPSSELNQDEDQQYITYVSFATMGSLLVPQYNKRNGSVNSAVVSITVSDLKRREFKEPIAVVFHHQQHKDMKNWNSSCVFWDMSSKPGYWSSDGCHVHFTNSSHTVCHCYHLTSFAVLMNVKGDVSTIIKGHHKLALTTITYVGVVLSVSALCLTFVTFLAFRFLKSSRTFIHTNLAFVLILAQLLFLFGINKTRIKLVCQLIAGLLHYVWLASFFWMALEGVMLYLMLIKVFGTKNMTRKKRIIFLTAGWFTPLIVVAVSAGLFPEGYGTQYYCWLSLDKGFIWAFVGPALLVITFNFLMLGITFSVMSRRGGHRRKPSKIRKIRYWAKACTLLTCILGLTWLFGVFYVNHQTLFMAYFFTIFNSLQGVFIFMFHCVGDEKIRHEYIRLICCKDKGPVYTIASNSKKSDDSTSKKSCKTMETGASSKLLPFQASSTGTRGFEGHRPVLIMYQKRSSLGPRSSSNQDDSESFRSSDRISGEIIENPRDSSASFSSFKIQNRYSLVSRDDSHDQQSEEIVKLQPLGELSIVQEDIAQDSTCERSK